MDYFQTKKQNSFMRDYYGKQQEMQIANFNNSANSGNQQMSDAYSRGLSMQGIAPDSAEGKAKVAEYLNTWGAKPFKG
jgi:hypothetical protein